MNLALWASIITCSLSIIIPYTTATGLRLPPGYNSNVTDRGVRRSDTLRLCQGLQHLLSTVLSDAPTTLTNLKRHLELEQYHQSQLLDVELQLAVQQNGYAIEDYEQQAALHRKEISIHESARVTITAQLQQELISRGALNGTNDGEHDIASAASGTYVGPADLRFLPQCLLASRGTSPYSVPDQQRPVAQPDQSAPGIRLHQKHSLRSHARPRPFPDHGRPLVSLLVQYFNRSWMLPLLAEPFRRCSAAHGGLASGSSSPLSSSNSSSSLDEGGSLEFSIEMLINVDSKVDATAVAEFAAGPLGAGFVVLVYSNNVHEIRSYNRLARMARGKILIMMQDDDVFPADMACVWLTSVVRAFRRWPRLGAVGSQRYVFDYHPNTTDSGGHFWDPGAGTVRVAGPGGANTSSSEGRNDGSGTDLGSSREDGKDGISDSHNGADDSSSDTGRKSSAEQLDDSSSDVSGGSDSSNNNGAGRRRRLRVLESQGGGSQGGGSGEEGVAADTDTDPGTDTAANGDDVTPAFADDGRLRLQFVSIIDYAPIAVRRSAFLGVGGIDENMSDSGMCGVHSDYDLAMRMWLAGWQVAYIEMPGLAKDPREEEGGTHRPGVSGYCWERQWELAIAYVRSRWGQHNRWNPESYYWFGSNIFEVIAEHVRLLNLRLLAPLADPRDGFCPFGYGCNELPVDRITGVPRPVSPLFGNLSSWPKHLHAPWVGGRLKGKKGGARHTIPGW